MYLKSLELFGFKSFPDRTVLNFDTGATVVVGPNGSGKSNLSDAMRWVLGEISSRSIRGTKMEDVIFGGTDDRKQMNFAEVSVTFDNEDRQIDTPFDEVIVTRRIYRKGESEYYINRRAVRLRDVHELFLNTGVGREGYSIIGQGRIAEIISQKSEERRAIFEEAAGISKYRCRKEEAEAKLTAVDGNLDRVSDIAAELEGRVGPLEKEAEKAKQYLAYYEVKKRDDVSLWLYDMGRLSSELSAADDRVKLAKSEMDIAEDAAATLEGQNERLYETLQESKYRSEQLQTQLDDSAKEAHELDSRIRLTENDIEHRKKQLEDKAAEKTKLEERRRALAAEKTGREAALAAGREKTETLNAELETLERKESGLRESRAALAKKLDDGQSELKRSEERLVECRIRLSVLDTTGKNDSDKEKELLAEIGRYTESSALLEARAAKAETTLADYRVKAEELKKKSDDISGQIETCRKEKQELIDRANAIYLDYTAKKHRIDAIRRMEELLEGYSQSVRFVMNEYDAGRIAGTSRVSDASASGGRIWGPVSRLIQASSRYVLAIETALGANIQNIIVDDEAAAKAAILHLKQKNAGRATFYPITSMKPRYSPIPEDECARYAGYLGTADRVIRFDERFGGVIRNLLGATLIFDNIDNASVMAKATGYRVRVVTLDGQVINAGGSFTGGSAKRDSGMLTRRTETDKLKNDVEALGRSLDELKKAQEECDRRGAALSHELSGVMAQNTMLTSLSGAENTQLEVIRSQLDSEKGMKNSLTQDLEKLRTGAAQREEGVGALRDEITALSAKAAEIAASRSADAEKLGSVDTSLEQLEQEKSGLLVRRAEAAKDAENAAQELAQTDARLAECGSEAEENEHLSKQLTGENRQAAETLAELREALAAKLEEGKKLEKERALNTAKNLEYEQKLNQLRVQMKEKNAKKELCFRELTLAQSKLKGFVEERDKLTARLWDDYELTYSGAVECGYPAVTEETRREVQNELNEYRGRLKALGNVSLSAIDEYAKVKERYDFLTAQINDLTQSKTNLLDIIVRLETEMRETFASAFEEIGHRFGKVFRELFGGGTAELSLTDPANVLTSGIEIRVAPPGKIIKSLTLLSGGEQAFVAIALIFAILQVNPTPFCIFDEIEAALDEANVFRFADYLKRYSDRTQFIVITHRRGTMEVADRIYGVTMQERGISKVLALDVGMADGQTGDTDVGASAADEIK